VAHDNNSILRKGFEGIELKTVRDFIFGSKFLRLFAFPIRLRSIAIYNIRNVYKSIVWLLKSSEFTNYNYDISMLNRNYLVSFIAYVTKKNFDEVDALFLEIENNERFKEYIAGVISNIKRKYELPKQVFFARRLGWYALIRILKPALVVETGTDKGLGTLLIAQALKENGTGKVYSVDVDPFSGALINESDWGNVELLRGNSLEELKSIKNIDMFIHDSDHSKHHEFMEFESITSNLTKNAIVISDNSQFTDALLDWSNKNNRRFIFFKEESKNHWYPGDGIGISQTKSM
jgi:predicted O-methyltransferase YrrM